jgi:hypothetical protein
VQCRLIRSTSPLGGNVADARDVVCIENCASTTALLAANVVVTRESDQSVSARQCEVTRPRKRSGSVAVCGREWRLMESAEWMTRTGTGEVIDEHGAVDQGAVDECGVERNERCLWYTEKMEQCEKTIFVKTFFFFFPTELFDVDKSNTIDAAELENVCDTLHFQLILLLFYSHFTPRSCARSALSQPERNLPVTSNT